MPDDIFSNGPGEEAEGIFTEGSAVDVSTTRAQKNAPDRLPRAVQDTSEVVGAGRRGVAGSVPARGPSAEQAAAPGPKKLVAVIGDRGQMLVAHHVAGNQVENWRQPTKQELAEFRSRGAFQSLALTNPGSGPTGLGAAAEQASGLLANPAVKWGLVAVGGVLALGGGWYAYNRWVGPFIEERFGGAEEEEEAEDAPAEEEEPAEETSEEDADEE